MTRLLPMLLILSVAAGCTCSKNPDATPSAPVTQAEPAKAPIDEKIPTTPEEIVTSFVTVSATAQSMADRDRLLKLCAGEMRRAFERMTEENFRLAYINSGLKVKELKLVAIDKKDDVTKVSYRVAVENSQGTDTTSEINEREVELTKSQGAWYIESIRLKGSDKIAFTNGMMF